MKKLLLIIAIFIISLSSYGQSAKETHESNSDKFALKTGVLLQKNVSEIGKFKSISFDLIEIINLTDKSKVKSIRLKLPAAGDYTIDYVGTIDNDEVDGLIKSLELIKSNAITIAPPVYTEVSYKCRSGFQSGAYYDDKEKAWVYYLQMEYSKKSSKFFAATELDELLTLLSSAKSKLL